MTWGDASGEARNRSTYYRPVTSIGRSHPALQVHRLPVEMARPRVLRERLRAIDVLQRLLQHLHLGLRPVTRTA